MANGMSLFSTMILLGLVLATVVNGQTSSLVTQNTTCGDKWIYHPHNRFSTTHLTWSEANLSCASTGGRLLPANIQNSQTLFNCLATSTNLAIFAPATSSYVWIDRDTVTWLCPAVNLAHDERTLALNCYMTSRFLCISDIIAPPSTAMTSGSTTAAATATTPIATTAPADTPCPAGHHKLNGACIDIDECAQRYCSNQATCTNSIGSYMCRCNAGFSGDGLTCVDINECSSKTKCHYNATCTNTKGSHICACRRGYTGNGVQCTQVDECIAGLHNCASNATCTDTPGSWTCNCNRGYLGAGTKCVDINECRTIPCNVNATCTNIPGSFVCQCRSGYTGNGFNCSDVDECNGTLNGGLNPCGEGRPCINTVSSFACPCQSNYTGIYQCGAPATTLQAKTIISISTGIGAGVIGLVGLLLAALYMRSHNEVHRYLKQAILAPEDKPFTSTVGAAGDLPDPTDDPQGGQRRYTRQDSRASSQISLVLDSNYAAFTKNEQPSATVEVAEQEEGLYVETMGRR